MTLKTALSGLGVATLLMGIPNEKAHGDIPMYNITHKKAEDLKNLMEMKIGDDKTISWGEIAIQNEKIEKQNITIDLVKKIVISENITDPNTIDEAFVQNVKNICPDTVSGEGLKLAIRVVARGIDMDSNPQLRETKIRAVLQNGKGIFDGASFPDGEIEINLLEGMESDVERLRRKSNAITILNREKVPVGTRIICIGKKYTKTDDGGFIVEDIKEDEHGYSDLYIEEVKDDKGNVVSFGFSQPYVKDGYQIYYFANEDNENNEITTRIQTIKNQEPSKAIYSDGYTLRAPLGAIWGNLANLRNQVDRFDDDMIQKFLDETPNLRSELKKGIYDNAEDFCIKCTNYVQEHPMCFGEGEWPILTTCGFDCDGENIIIDFVVVYDPRGYTTSEKKIFPLGEAPEISLDNIEPKENLTFTSGETITAKSFFEDLPGGVTVSVKEGENITTNIGENTVTVMLKYEEQTRFMEIRYFVEKSQEQIETERVQGIVDQINQYKDQVNAIETVDYSSLITKMNNTTSDKLSSEIAGVIDEVSDVIQNLNAKTQAAKGVIQAAKSFVETHKNDASSEVRAKIAELEGIVKSKEEEITTMESQRTTLSEGLVELNNAKTEAENREKAEQNEAERQEEERVQGIVDQINQYKDQVNAIETVDYSSLITKMNNTTSDKLSSEIAGVIDEVSDVIQNLNAKTQAAKGVIQAAKSFVETHKNDASSEVRAKIAELEGIVKSKEEEITTMESQRTTLSEGLVELNNAKTEAENREKAQQNAAEALEKARNSAKKYFDKVNAIEDIDIELQEGLSFANAIGRLEDMIKNSNATKTDLESAMDDCKTAESNYNSAKQTKENQEKQRNFEEAVEGIVSAITNAKGEIEAYSDEFGNTKLKNPLDDRELAEKGISYTIDETTLTLWGFDQSKQYEIVILPPEEIKTPVAEVIPNEQNITILGNGTSNPSVEVDPSMAGKKYKVISITGGEVREGIIEDTTIDFGNMKPGVYLLGIEGMPRGAAKKIIVQ